ncbi:acyl carrier protein (plasmid) [Streptomyces sp. NBC_01527]|uniref:acyl carrier protein n=1 Tax=Streptomyces sp. NBC_01527 TaxID=2903894 RepID=UPI002F91A1A1
MTSDLATILRDDLKLPPDQLTPDASLDGAGFDSLAIVELSVLLGERYGIDISEAEIKSAATLDQLDLLIQRKRDER